MENWHINEFWNDEDGNATQWVHNEKPLYIDLIDERYEVNYEFKLIYRTDSLENAMEYGENYER